MPLPSQSVYGETQSLQIAHSSSVSIDIVLCDICVLPELIFTIMAYKLYIFVTPSLPSTIISLHTNLRKCSHFPCICLFPTPFSGLQFIEVLIYVSAQIVFCFSQWEPCQANSVLTGFYYSPRHIFFYFWEHEGFPVFFLIPSLP